MRIVVGEKWTRFPGADPMVLGDLLQRLPEPPFRMNGDTDYCRTNHANLLHLAQEFPEQAMWDDPHGLVFTARGYRFLSRIRDQEIPIEEVIKFPFKVNPDPWQIPVFWYGRTMKNIALAPAALGTGKTKMALDIAASKFLAGEIDGVVIVAPNGVHRQWVRKGVPDHLSPAVNYIAHTWKPTIKMPKRFPLENNESLRRLRILACNVEAFSTESGRAARVVSDLLKTGKWLLIMDESTRIKNGRAVRTRVLTRLARHAASRMILTGTPVTKGLEDFYAQFNFLDPNIIGLSSYMAFRNRYCVTIPAFRGAAQGAVRIIGYKNREELFRKLAPVTFMIDSEVLGLGEPIHERRELEMTAEQSEIYTALAEQLVDRLRTMKVASVSNTLVELLRLQQVLCGEVHEPTIDENGVEGTKVRKISSNRLHALRNALEEIDGPVVIWARFQHDIDEISEMLEKLDAAAQRGEHGRRWRHVVYDGRVTNVAERERRVDAFARGEVEYFVGNQGAGGTGIDGLQHTCNHAIYYSNSFNREHRFQSMGRIYRRGQTAVGRVTYLDLVVPGTVDELFLSAIDSTTELAEMVLKNPSMLTGGLK